jgi:hypothetical protein
MPCILTLGLLICCAQAPAGSPVESADFTWPAYQTQRFREDYSQLYRLHAVPARDWADSIKYIPLNDAGDVWLSLGGQARWRYEGVRNYLFDPHQDDPFYFLHRYFLWGSVNFGPDVRIFAEGKSAWAHDRDLPGGRRVLDHDELDLQNAFFEWRTPRDHSPGLLVRAGRQELLYGRQRLISPLDWSNTRRTWDGVVGQVRGASWSVDAFAAWFAPVRKYEFNETDTDHGLWGLYSTLTRLGGTGHNLDAYLLGQHRDPSPAVNVDRYTAGGRLWGPLSPHNLAYEVEGAYQFGQSSGLSIDAFMFTAEVSQTLREVAWTPVLTAGIDYASGDRNAADGRSRTFNQLYPLGHAYLGYVDVVGRQNIIDLRFTARVSPATKLWLQLDVHNFWRAQRRDALYDAGGNAIRTGGPGTSRRVGTELDVTLGYAFDHHWQMLLGYSHFFAGSFITDSPQGGSDIDFWYAQLTWTF